MAKKGSQGSPDDPARKSEEQAKNMRLFAEQLRLSTNYFFTFNELLRRANTEGLTPLTQQSKMAGEALDKLSVGFSGLTRQTLKQVKLGVPGAGAGTSQEPARVDQTTLSSLAKLQATQTGPQPLANLASALRPGALGSGVRPPVTAQDDSLSAWGKAGQQLRDFGAHLRGSDNSLTRASGRLAQGFGNATSGIGMGAEKLSVGFGVASEAVKKFMAKVGEWASASSPQTMSTFQKSMQLVSIQLGRPFLPIIIEASKALQEFAEWLKKVVNSEFGKVARGAVSGLASTLNPFSALAKAKDFGVGMFTAPVKTLKEAGEGIASSVVSLKDTVVDLVKTPFGAEGRTEITGTKWGRAAGMALAKAGLSEYVDSSGLLHDLDKPTGYQARFIGQDEVRRQVQLAALNMTGFDAKILKEVEEIRKEMLSYIRGPSLPGR